MSSSLSDRLLEIDNQLQRLAEEQESLLNERNNILAQQEVELAKHFNQHASPEAKVDLFISYFKGHLSVSLGIAKWAQWFVLRVRIITLQLAQCTDVLTTQRMNTGNTVLQSVHMNQTFR